jgi:hypothetical protein
MTAEQVLRDLYDLDGRVVAQATVRHTYRFRDGLVTRMDVTEARAAGG